MQMGRTFLLGLLLSLPSWGDSICPALLTTSFGIRGPLIASLETSGQLTILNDSYASGFVPAFTVATQPISLPFYKTLHALSSVPDTQKSGGFLAAVSGQGALTLVLPDGRPLDTLLPRGSKVRSASLYRVPVREVEKNWVHMKNLRAQSDPGVEAHRERRKTAERVDFSEKYSIVHVFMGIGNKVFRASMRYRDISDEDDRLRKAVVNGFVYAERDETAMKYLDFDISPVRFVDFNRLQRDRELLVATSDVDRVVAISDFQEVFTLPESAIMSEMDYLQAVSDEELVVGSESGEVLHINLANGKVNNALRFPSPIYLTSLSAHRSEGHLEVWAVGGKAAGPVLFKWESTFIGPIFKSVDEFPKGIAPQQVVSFGSPIPVSYKGGNRGYLSTLHNGPEGAELEEVLVLGTDGSLSALRDRVGCVELHCEQEWVNFPFIRR
jgi:hypothetical protein